MKIIVLSITPYKEKDAIINAITENETITFLAKDLKNPKSKNAPLNNILTVADIELMDGSFKHPILKSSKSLSTSLKVEMNAEYLGTLLILDEMVLNLFPEEDQYVMFHPLENALDNLRKNNDWLMTLLLFMATAIRLGGFQLEVNKCVMCGSTKNIVTFSFNDGGFICQNCFQTEMGRELSKNQMLLLRKIVNCPDYRLQSADYAHEDLMALLARLTQYIEEAFGYHFKNMRLLFNSK